MSYSFNQKNKVTHKINELKRMTTIEYSKLQPEKFISHRKTVDFMKEHKILPKLG
jgi:hypothetical protein